MISLYCELTHPLSVSYGCLKTALDLCLCLFYYYYHTESLYSLLSDGVLPEGECLSMKTHHQHHTWATGKPRLKVQPPYSSLRNGVDSKRCFPQEKHQLVSVLMQEQRYCKNTVRDSVPRLLLCHQKSEL